MPFVNMLSKYSPLGNLCAKILYRILPLGGLGGFCMPLSAENVSLSTPHTSFVLDLDKGAEPQFLYYGPAIGNADIANLQKLKDDNWTRSEVYPAYGATHTMNEVCLAMRHADGNLSTNLIIDDTVLCSVSNIETTLEFFSLDNDQKTFTIEGYHVLFDVLEKEPVEPYYIINDQPVPCEVITRSDTIQWLGDTIATKIGFKVVLPLNAELITCQPALMLRKTLIPKRNIEYGAFFPISQVYKYSYAKVFNRFIVISDGRLIISNQHASFKTLPRECLLLSEIWQKNATGGKKAVLGRLFYHCVKPFKKKQESQQKIKRFRTPAINRAE